ncbi:hypothetical protein MCOR25_005866 [Pyricularia grisea]|uniref:Nucleoporin NUP53 n=1 Tax=Pyricularia grisea TaxID=148305 RepID=A0A6P8AYZ5_PYRGI|nr:hypothetical protein PgNI_10589 [Pyricularia grisea]KAI6363583.1 hypothetical protein MCOR25_005866 [Pyricularia grisea]TLD07560.1 hypothetical protein PgNI_10589 [Pyricularia grisea]
MAPLILHNVPDDELYVGEDGKQRPYAMVFSQNEGHHASARGRRAVAETGSFGRSARRSRSKTATPARKEDPTLAAADQVFKQWFATQKKSKDEDEAQPTQQRKPSGGQPTDNEAASATSSQFSQKQVPFEVILRGYRSARQQYAAIAHYEQLAGPICEDYARDPPIDNRRYKSELRDSALQAAHRRRRALTPEERARVNRADGGEHWVKVTFESAAAAEAAMSVSPQRILGHLVYCEPYQGIPPSDQAVPDNIGEAGELLAGYQPRASLSFPSRGPPRTVNDYSGGTTTIPKSMSTPALPGKFSPSNSLTSSRTMDTGTLDSLADSATVSSATATGQPGFTTAVDVSGPSSKDSAYCRAAPAVRKTRLLPAEQALLPQQSYAQRALDRIPFLKWFSGSMIGNEVPRTENGDFDWDKASLYWKFIWWLDSTFRLFGGEIISADKDD